MIAINGSSSALSNIQASEQTLLPKSRTFCNSTNPHTKRVNVTFSILLCLMWDIPLVFILFSSSKTTLHLFLTLTIQSLFVRGWENKDIDTKINKSSSSLRSTLKVSKAAHFSFQTNSHGNSLSGWSDSRGRFLSVNVPMSLHMISSSTLYTDASLHLYAD